MAAVNGAVLNFAVAGIGNCVMKHVETAFSIRR